MQIELAPKVYLLNNEELSCGVRMASVEILGYGVASAPNTSHTANTNIAYYCRRYSRR